VSPVPPRLYFEDVDLHGMVETPAMTVTEAHVQAYEGLTRELGTDPRTVPDLLPLCLTIGLGWRTAAPPLVVLAFMGLEWNLLRPLQVGDTIHSRARVVTKRPMRGSGIIVEQRDVINQLGEVVQQGKFTFLVAKRPKEVAA